MLVYRACSRPKNDLEQFIASGERIRPRDRTSRVARSINTELSETPRDCAIFNQALAGRTGTSLSQFAEIPPRIQFRTRRRRHRSIISKHYIWSDHNSTEGVDCITKIRLPLDSRTEFSLRKRGHPCYPAYPASCNSRLNAIRLLFLQFGHCDAVQPRRKTES